MFQLQPPPTARRPPGKSSTAREYATVSLAPQEKNPFSTAHAQLSNPRSGWRSAPLLLSLSLALSLFCNRVRRFWPKANMQHTTSMRSNSVMRTSWARVGAQGRTNKQVVYHWAVGGGGRYLEVEVLAWRWVRFVANIRKLWITQKCVPLIGPRWEYHISQINDSTRRKQTHTHTTETECQSLLSRACQQRLGVL